MCNPSSHRILHQQTLKDCGVPQVVVSFLFPTSFFINDWSHFCIQCNHVHIIYTFVYAWFDYTYILIHISQNICTSIICSILIVFFGVHLSHPLTEFLQVLVLLPCSCHVVLPGHRDHWFDCCLEFWSFAFFFSHRVGSPREKNPNRMAIVNLPPPAKVPPPQKNRAY